VVRRYQFEGLEQVARFQLLASSGRQVVVDPSRIARPGVDPLAPAELDEVVVGLLAGLEDDVLGGEAEGLRQFRAERPFLESI
jgi:hypothetical protein